MIVGSYVPDGVDVGTSTWVLETARGVVAFYDIDTPVTLAKLRRGEHEYLTPDLIREHDLYLSFAGGPTLTILESEFGSPRARPLYNSVDPSLYFPARTESPLWDFGYMGTYSEDRQPPQETLLLEAANPVVDRTIRGSRFSVSRNPILARKRQTHRTFAAQPASRFL